MVGLDKQVTVLKELKEHILPLSEEEYTQLEKNIIGNGCLDPLVVWEKKDKSLILVDGHNRFRICKKNNIPFKIKKVSFSNIDDVKNWMVDHQIGRRNLTPDQLSYYRGLKYLSMRRKRGGYDNVKQKGSEDQSTSEVLAGQFNVSESTIKRDAKFAEGLNIIGQSNAKLKQKILSGEAKVKKADIQTLLNAKNPQELVIRNEADLYNKAKIIRDEVLNEVEANVKKIENERIDRAVKILKEHEPVFLDKADRLKRIKGMIISAINNAINNRDANSLKELKKYIDKLADELFD